MAREIRPITIFQNDTRFGDTPSPVKNLRPNVVPTTAEAGDVDPKDLSAIEPVTDSPSDSPESKTTETHSPPVPPVKNASAAKEPKSPTGQVPLTGGI